MNRCHRAARGQRGFSLLELLAALVVSGVLAAVGIPSMQNLMLNSARTAVLNDFVAAIQLARNEVPKHHQPVVVCPERNGQCIASREAWNGGWMVFVNLDKDEPPRRDQGERLLHVFPKASGDIVVSANRASFSFRRFGTRHTNGTVRFCDARGPAYARVVVVAPSGKLRTASREPGGREIGC